MTDIPGQDRFRFDPVNRLVLIRSGKVEIGQHLHDTYRRMVATAFAIDESALQVAPVSTAHSPDDGLTAGSFSISITGVALRAAAQDLSAHLRSLAAQRLNAGEEDIVLSPVDLIFEAGDARIDLFDLVADRMPSLIAPPTGRDLAELPSYAGSITGARRFIQDMVLPGMLHARAVRGWTADHVRPLLDPTQRIVTTGGFTAVIAESEAALESLFARLPDRAQAPSHACDGPVADWIKTRDLVSAAYGQTAAITADVTVQATRPFLLHGSIAPCCGLAQWDGARLTVWSHSQNIFQVRDKMALVLDLTADQIEVRHVPSSGCYGHNAADDAALDAALVAMQVPGQPVRVAWRRVDELHHGPVGAPMLVEVRAALDDQNRITAWRQDIWSGPHGQRPGLGGNVNFLAAGEVDPAMRTTRMVDLPIERGGAAGRNGKPVYAVPDQGLTIHIVQDLPVRSSSLRALGTHLNTIAIEAAMDELAQVAGQDPVAFRLAHLEDPRARAVLRNVADRVDVHSAELADDPEQAIGIAFGQYKNSAAYAAVAVRVRLEDEPVLTDIWSCVDAGFQASLDGVLHQIEGGLLQAASWTLREGVLLRGGQIDAAGWDDYPVLDWAEMPRLHIETVEYGPEEPPLGVGEAMAGPVAAAIVSAVSRVLGQPMTHLPLDRARLIAALSGG